MEMMTTRSRELYGSLDEMLSPEALSRLEGRAVSSVRRQPFVSPYGGVSGNQFLSVETRGNDEARAGDGQPRAYVVKRTAPAWDIIMRISEDAACREVLVWQHGLLDRLPPEVGHTVVAGAIDGEGWALLMRDITEQMHPCQRWPDPGWAPLSQRELQVFLDGLAALHEQYWEDSALLDPRLGLCDLPRLYASFSPAIADREAGSPHPLVTVLRDGWQQFERVARPDLVRLVQGLQADLRPLCDALDRYPWTLVHGDPNCKNFGIELAPTPRILLLDWQLVTRAPPAVDLAYFLALFSDVLPVPYEEAVEQYRARLAARLGSRFDERWWRPQLDLAMLGHFLRFGGLLTWRMTYHGDPYVREHYQMVLAWWTERALAGSRWL
jgi:hypothetical protein